MDRQPFEVRVDAEGVFWLSGELDLEQADVLSEVGAAHLADQQSVVLDCSGLTFLDSSGLRAMLTLAADLPDGVVVRDPPPNVRTVLDIAAVGEAVGLRVEPSS